MSFSETSYVGGLGENRCYLCYEALKPGERVFGHPYGEKQVHQVHAGECWQNVVDVALRAQQVTPIESLPCYVCQAHFKLPEALEVVVQQRFPPLEEVAVENVNDFIDFDEWIGTLSFEQKLIYNICSFVKPYLQLNVPNQFTWEEGLASLRDHEIIDEAKERFLSQLSPFQRSLFPHVPITFFILPLEEITWFAKLTPQLLHERADLVAMLFIFKMVPQYLPPDDPQPPYTMDTYLRATEEEKVAISQLGESFVNLSPSEQAWYLSLSAEKKQFFVEYCSPYEGFVRTGAPQDPLSPYSEHLAWLRAALAKVDAHWKKEVIQEENPLQQGIKRHQFFKQLLELKKYPFIERGLNGATPNGSIDRLTETDKRDLLDVFLNHPTLYKSLVPALMSTCSPFVHDWIETLPRFLPVSSPEYQLIVNLNIPHGILTASDGTHYLDGSWQDLLVIEGGLATDWWTQLTSAQIERLNLLGRELRTASLEERLEFLELPASQIASYRARSHRSLSPLMIGYLCGYAVTQLASSHPWAAYGTAVLLFLASYIHHSPFSLGFAAALCLHSSFIQNVEQRSGPRLLGLL